MRDLGIVIVNWNTRDLLRRCLASVFASQGGVDFEVVVVDNASSDGSADMVAAEFPHAQLICEPVNTGYPAANNRGLEHLGYAGLGGTIISNPPRYALLLNPDTELPFDALSQMVGYMDSDTAIGVAGPKLVLPDGRLDLACRRSFPSPEVSLWRMIGFSRLFPRHPRFARYNLTFLDENAINEVDSVVGAFMMVRREAIYQVGLMDERFFMYGEDLDWCKRLKERGWKVMYYPRVQVKHVKRAASVQSARAKYEFVRAMLLFYNKHYRAQTPLPLHIAVLAGIALQGGPRIWPEIADARSRPSGGQTL